MAAEPVPEFLQPHWFIPLFIAGWLAITGLLSLMSGWARLAKNYPAINGVSGDRFRFASGSVGRAHMPVTYSNCLFVTVSPEGLRLSILFLFRFLSPPFFLPWSAVVSVEEKQVFFFKFYALSVRDHSSHITLRGAAGLRMKQQFEASVAPGSPRSPWNEGPRQGLDDAH